MTWKSTIVVSGVGLVATWMGVYTPFELEPPRQARAAATSAAARPDIEEQADRLQTRVQQETLYREPSRNPFRFTPAAAPRPTQVATTPQPAPQPVAVTPPQAPPLRLAGIAADTVDGVEQRTAIVSAPGGVQLVKVGDEIAGLRVTAISDDAIELVAPADGTSLTLRLSTSNSQ